MSVYPNACVLLSANAMMFSHIHHTPRKVRSVTSCRAHLPQLLHERVEPLILGLGGGRHRAAQRHLRLQLQQAAHVVGLLAGRLLQQRLLIGLPVLCHLALVGVGLAERLGGTERKQGWSAERE